MTNKASVESVLELFKKMTICRTAESNYCAEKGCEQCEFAYDDEWDITALPTSIESLEKQIPKKLVGTEKWADSCCPNCKQFLGKRVFEFIELDYCPKCGQKLDWSIDEE